MAIDTNSRRTVFLGTLYNPAVILIVLFTGGFDAVTMAALVAAVYWLARDHRPIWSAIALALATGLRMYPVVCLPAIALWLARRAGPRTAIHYVVVWALATAVTFAPVLLDLKGFQETAATQNDLGPFSISLVTAPAFEWLASQAQVGMVGHDLVRTGMVSLMAILLGLTYWRLARRDIGLIASVMAPLLVLYALYPKMHGLYIAALVPLSFLAGSPAVRGIWVPGVIWYLLFNGAFGATGLFYFLAPLTGVWADTYQFLGLPESGRPGLWLGLVLAYTAWCLIAAVKLQAPPPDARSGPGLESVTETTEPGSRPGTSVRVATA